MEHLIWERTVFISIIFFRLKRKKRKRGGRRLKANPDLMADGTQI